jgi:hypothetical protein
MKKTVLLFLSVISFSTYAQSPGGVSGSEIWCKVNKITPLGTTFQNKDFSSNNKTITTGIGSVLTPSFFNYNYSFSYDNTDYISYLSKLESLKDATVFIVNLPTPPADPTTKYGLINTDWSVTVPATSVNEQSFQFSTSTFEKNVVSLTYPSGSYARPNGRINTLLWHNFNSKKIVNSFGSNGESNIFIGKSFTNAANFVGQIPEVIVYRKALNDKEKWRVESYLALKYGITLQPEVNYFTSKNEIFWHKENNILFKNRIFGLGKDSNSTLNQKQSTSVHDPSVLKRMIFWMGSLQADNNLNISFIEDQNFVTIGDNNGAELPNTILQNGIRKIDRTWLVEKFGPSAHNLVTSLKYKPDPSVTLLPNEAFWLVVDKNSNNTALSNFNGTNNSYYPVSSFDSDGYAVFNNLKWASDTATYNQFTFGKGPRMLVIPTVLPLACTDSQGTVNIAIKGGQPVFTINVHGTDNSYNLQLNQPGFDLALSLNTGHYQVTVTDATGYIQTATFEISPTQGIALELGPNQYLISGNTILLDASLQVTSTTVSYQWFKDGNIVATTPMLLVTDTGNYQCIITDITSGCAIEDTIVITLVQELAKGNYSSIYPNPTKATDAFTVKIHLDVLASAIISISDVLGKILETRNLYQSKEHESSFKLNTAGIYFIKIESPDYSTTHKIIIN